MTAKKRTTKKAPAKKAAKPRKALAIPAPAKTLEEGTWLDDIKDGIDQAFRSAPEWTDGSVKVRQRWKLVNRKPVSQGPMTGLPADPFTLSAVVPADLEALGRKLARYARSYGEPSADGLVLSVTEEGLAPVQPAYTITVSKR